MEGRDFSCSLANTFQLHSKSTRGRDCHLPGMAKGRGGVRGRCDAAFLGGQLESPHVLQCSSISRAAAGNTPKGYLQIFSHDFLACWYHFASAQSQWENMLGQILLSCQWGDCWSKCTHRLYNSRSIGTGLCRYTLYCLKVYREHNSKAQKWQLCYE